MSGIMNAFIKGSLDLFARWPVMPEKDEQEPGWAKDARALQKDLEKSGLQRTKTPTHWSKASNIK